MPKYREDALAVLRSAEELVTGFPFEACPSRQGVSRKDAAGFKNTRPAAFPS